MPDNEIPLEVKIKIAESATSVKELKASLKQLKDELDKVPAGSEGFKKLTKTINETEGKVGDLNDQFKTLTGSGVERATSSFALLREGFTNFDFDKIKIGFKGLGAAMSALPMFLIAQAIQYVIENFDEIISVVKDFIGVSREGEIEAKRLTESLEAQGKAISDLAEISDKYTKQELLNAKLRGASESEQTQITENGYKRKIQAARDFLEEATNIYNKLLKNDEATTEQVHKAAEEQISAQKNLKKLESELSTFKLQNQVDVNEKSKTENKKYLDDKKADERKHLDDLYQMHLAEVAKFNQMHADEAAANKQAILDEDAKLKQSQIDGEIEYQNSSMAIESKANSDKEFAEAESLARRKEGYKQLQGSQLELTKQTLQSAQALSDLYFGHQLKMAKGNADKEREIKKKQFNVNKAFGVANSIIDGVGAIQKALNNPYPLNIILAVLTGVLATANTIKIASSKFDDGGGSSGSAGDIGGGAVSAPVIPQPNNTTTQLNPNGSPQGQNTNANQQPIIIKAEMSEVQATDTHKRIIKIKESATYG